MRKLIKILKALSDPNRIRILKMLQVRPLCVCEMSDVLQLANSTVSKHLSILRNVELIDDEKRGKWVNYHLNRSRSEQYVSELMPLLANWLPEDATIRCDAEKVSTVDRHALCVS
jgi:ArsR family transcriptional regulator